MMRGCHIPRSPGYLAPLFGLLAEIKHTRARSNSTQPYVHAHNLVIWYTTPSCNLHTVPHLRPPSVYLLLPPVRVPPLAPLSSF